MDFATAYENYLAENDLDRWEGERGVKNLEQVVEDIGYRRANYQHGDPIHRFLADNPGAIEAIHRWISDTGLSEWYDNLGLEEFEEREEEEIE